MHGQIDDGHARLAAQLHVHRARARLRRLSERAGAGPDGRHDPHAAVHAERTGRGRSDRAARPCSRWSPSTPVSGEIVGYRVFRDEIPVGQTATPGMTLESLAPSSTYQVTVVAVDSLGAISAPTRAARSPDRRPRRRRHGHVQAFLLASTDQSFDDLQAHYQQIGVVYPTYFDCGVGGEVTGDDDPLVTGWAQAREVAVMPRLNCQNPNDENQILNEPAAGEKMIEQLAALCATYGYQGIQVDFEGAPAGRAQPVHRVHHGARRQAALPGGQAVDDRHRQVLQHPERARRDVRRRGAVGALGLRVRARLGQALDDLGARWNGRTPVVQERRRIHGHAAEQEQVRARHADVRDRLAQRRRRRQSGHAAGVQRNHGARRASSGCSANGNRWRPTRTSPTSTATGCRTACGTATSSRSKCAWRSPNRSAWVWGCGISAARTRAIWELPGLGGGG